MLRMLIFLLISCSLHAETMKFTPKDVIKKNIELSKKNLLGLQSKLRNGQCSKTITIKNCYKELNDMYNRLQVYSADLNSIYLYKGLLQDYRTASNLLNKIKNSPVDVIAKNQLNDLINAKLYYIKTSEYVL